ncbi:hypothetical protein LPJ59_000596 [Coemansia sp. RSA 2399]|nr:hypothetical protein LPJ59_000596 [Coemansia sp. RSA 2399]KAJ1908360.1 hypothetical protein LPJ81_000151 [Coemansia sp. IMI 209127]
MQFTKVFVAIAAVAASVFAADNIDWTSPATLACTKENWTAIKAAADPMLGEAGLILNTQQQAALSSLLGGASTMPANPSDEFLQTLPTVVPASILDLIGGDIVSACLQTYEAPSASSSDAASPSSDEAATTDEAATSDEEAASSDEEVATSSAPAKCIPRA